MARSNSPRAVHRRHTLKTLNEAKRAVDRLRNWWTVTSKVYLLAEQRVPGSNTYQRDRKPGEYPEADPAYWAGTHAELDKLITELTALRDYAADQYFAVTADRIHNKEHAA